MNLGLGDWIVKALELIDRSPRLLKFAWALLAILLLHVVRWW